jgi:hypothetical protein
MTDEPTKVPSEISISIEFSGNKCTDIDFSLRSEPFGFHPAGSSNIYHDVGMYMHRIRSMRNDILITLEALNSKRAGFDAPLASDGIK